MSKQSLVVTRLKFTPTAAVCLALVTIGAGSGCRSGGSSPATDTTSATTTARSTPAPANNRTARQIQNAPDWAKVMSAWWEGIAGKPGTPSTPGKTTKPLRRVSINVVAIAARHPAWELAQALERDRSTPIALSPVAIQALQQAAAPGAFTVPNVEEMLATAAVPAFADPAAPSGRGPGNGNWTPGTVAGLDLPERRLIADEIQVLQQEVRAQQLSALNEFLREVQVRQNAARTEQADLLQLGLQYDIEAAQRAGLARLVPILPSEAMQLEMTNLRLELLENIYSTEARREAARRRLEELEAQWREELRRQEIERLAELRRILVEIPARVRREGEAQVVAYTEAARRRDAVFRQSVEEAQEGRVAQDFAPAASRLGIVLPAFSLPSQTIAGQPGGESATGFPASGGASRGELAGVDVPQLPPDSSIANIIRTFPRGLSSFPGSAAPNVAVANISTTPTASQIQQRRVLLIRALRALALRDAQRWSRMVAKRSGWDWPAGAPRPVKQPAQQIVKVEPMQEVTQEVLRALKLN